MAFVHFNSVLEHFWTLWTLFCLYLYFNPLWWMWRVDSSEVLPMQSSNNCECRNTHGTPFGTPLNSTTGWQNHAVKHTIYIYSLAARAGIWTLICHRSFPMPACYSAQCTKVHWTLFGTQLNTTSRLKVAQCGISFPTNSWLENSKMERKLGSDTSLWPCIMNGM